MEDAVDALLLEITDQVSPGLQVLCLDIVHMSIVDCVIRHVRLLDQSPVRQRLQRLVVAVPDAHSLVIDLVELLQLCPEVSHVQLTGKIGRTVVHPAVFIDLAAEELAAVCPFLADDLSSLLVSVIVEQQRSAFTHGVILGLMETVAAEVADRSERRALVKGIDTLGGILHHLQVMLPCNVKDPVHVTGHACVMNRADHTGLLRHCLFDPVRIDIHGLRIDINEYDLRPAQHKGVGRRDEGIRRHDDFIARLKIAQPARHLESRGAGGRHVDMAHVHPFLEPL